MKRAVIMVPNYNAGEDACTFEIFSRGGSWRSQLEHDVCPDVPPGESWGSDNLADPWDPHALEAAVRAAYPGSKITEWRGRLMLGTCPALLAARHRLDEARDRVKEALEQQGEAERLLSDVGMPRVVDTEDR